MPKNIVIYKFSMTYIIKDLLSDLANPSNPDYSTFLLQLELRLPI